jgi:thioredoxin reductase (NADPH)
MVGVNPVRKFDVVVIGSGMAGVTALIWLKQLGVNAILVERLQHIGGQIHKVQNKIKDYPGLFGVKGTELIQHLESQLREFKAEWKVGIEVKQIEIRNNRVFLCLNSQEMAATQEEWIESKYVILATGAEVRKLGIPGEDDLLDKYGELTASKDLHLFEGKHVLVIGGGDRAVEGAKRIKEVAKKITLVHRREEFRARIGFMKQVIEDRRVDIKRNAEVVELKLLESSKVQVLLKLNESGCLEMLEVDYVLVRIGVDPNINLIKHLVKFNGERVIIHSNGETSCDRIFAIGDVVNVPDYSSFSLCVGQGMGVAKKIWMLLQNQLNNEKS